MTFKEYVEKINEILKENPNWAELEVIPVEKWAEEDIVFPYRGNEKYGEDNNVCV